MRTGSYLLDMLHALGTLGASGLQPMRPLPRTSWIMQNSASMHLFTENLVAARRNVAYNMCHVSAHSLAFTLLDRPRTGQDMCGCTSTPHHNIECHKALLAQLYVNNRHAASPLTPRTAAGRRGCTSIVMGFSCSDSVCSRSQPSSSAGGTAAMLFWSSASTFSRCKEPSASGSACPGVRVYQECKANYLKSEPSGDVKNPAPPAAPDQGNCVLQRQRQAAEVHEK